MNPRYKRALSALVTVLALAFLAWDELGPTAPAVASREGVVLAGSPDRASTGAASDASLARAFRERARDLQIEGEGRVIALLPDDTQGSQHQRFLLELNTGQTLLVAHNIDLAPRVAGLQRGDRVRFYGEYEWTDKGGVIHWTHHDPGGRHAGGWLEHDGRRYE